MHRFNPSFLPDFTTRDGERLRRPAASRLRWLLGLALAATGVTANDAAAQRSLAWDFPQAHPIGKNLDVSTQIVLRTVTGVYDAPPPPATIAIPSAANVSISTPLDAAEIVGITWYKDGEPLAATAKTLAIVNATAADSGLYTAVVRRADGNPAPFASLFEQIHLQVGEPTPQKLINFSTRATIDESNRSLIAGFVIEGESHRPERPTFLLLRGVGPTLADHGVAQPLASPKVELFDRQGAKIVWPEAYIPEWNPYHLAHGVAPQVGATPLRPDGGDFAILYPLPAGAYTLHVTSADNSRGDVVLEIYEVPEEVIRSLEAVLPPVDNPKN